MRVDLGKGFAKLSNLLLRSHLKRACYWGIIEPSGTSFDDIGEVSSPQLTLEVQKTNNEGFKNDLT